MYSAINNIDSLNQRIRTVVQIDGVNKLLFIKLRWHKLTGKWHMSVDDSNEQPVVRNIPLLAGSGPGPGNLMRQLAHLGIGSAYVVPAVDHPSTENPVSDNLGLNGEFLLVWGDTVAE